MNAQQRDRRRFLKGGAALAGLTAGAIRSARGQTSEPEQGAVSQRSALDARAYGVRSRFETATRDVGGGPPSAETLHYVYPTLRAPLQDWKGIITPSALHYTVCHGYPPQQIDPRQHRLLIHGLVDRPLIFTMEELKGLPSVSRIHFVECNGNSHPHFGGKNPKTVQDAHGLTSCSEWTGVPLSVLLQEVGVQKGARWVDAESAEPVHFIRTISLEKALDDVMVAYGQNGEPTRPEQGYPIRLLVPGWVGSYNIKWLRRLKVVDTPEMGKWVTSMYARRMPDGKRRWFEMEMPPKSVITHPSGGQQLPGRGFYEITGLAWSGVGAIRRVEVSTDGGRTWKDAELQQPVLRRAHARFRIPWNWDGQEAVLQSRCTDELGQVQPTLEGLLKLFGVTLEQLPSFNGHFNAIQPWKVTREGSIHNVMFS